MAKDTKYSPASLVTASGDGGTGIISSLLARVGVSPYTDEDGA